MAIGLLLSSSTERPLEVTSWPFGVTDNAAPRVYASLPSLDCTASQVPVCRDRSSGLPVMCCEPGVRLKPASTCSASTREASPGP